MVELSQRTFARCICGEKLLVRSVNHAAYVIDGRPVCFSCFIRSTAGPESDWDCPPAWDDFRLEQRTGT